VLLYLAVILFSRASILAINTKEVSPTTIIGAIIENAKRVTANTRNFLEKYPNQNEPQDYVNYPGKVDHSTCICVKVAYDWIGLDWIGLILLCRHVVCVLLLFEGRLDLFFFFPVIYVAVLFCFVLFFFFNFKPTIFFKKKRGLNYSAAPSAYPHPQGPRGCAAD
jgi:hypothetical protein